MPRVRAAKDGLVGLHGFDLRNFNAPDQFGDDFHVLQVLLLPFDH